MLKNVQAVKKFMRRKNKIGGEGKKGNEEWMKTFRDRKLITISGYSQQEHNHARKNVHFYFKNKLLMVINSLFHTFYIKNY